MFVLHFGRVMSGGANLKRLKDFQLSVELFGHDAFFPMMGWVWEAGFWLQA